MRHCQLSVVVRHEGQGHGGCVRGEVHIIGDVEYTWGSSW